MIGWGTYIAHPSPRCSSKKVHHVRMQLHHGARLAAVVLPTLPFTNRTITHAVGPARHRLRSTAQPLGLDAAVAYTYMLLWRRQPACRPAQRRALVPVLAHTVHRTVADDLLNNDGALVTVQKLLGQANVQATAHAGRCTSSRDPLKLFRGAPIGSESGSRAWVPHQCPQPAAG